jgi:hypothetical protein
MGGELPGPKFHNCIRGIYEGSIHIEQNTCEGADRHCMVDVGYEFLLRHEGVRMLGEWHVVMDRHFGGNIFVRMYSKSCLYEILRFLVLLVPRKVLYIELFRHV